MLLFKLKNFVIPKNINKFIGAFMLPVCVLDAAWLSLSLYAKACNISLQILHLKVKTKPGKRINFNQ